MSISFHFQKTCKLPERMRLKHFLKKMFNTEHQESIGLEIIFCDDEYLLNINREFLQHDYYTDIISFNLAAPGEPIEGELYISVDRVRENAKEYSSSFLTELHRVIFHGVLHLCGYKDKSAPDQKRMRQKEQEYLSLYFKN